MNRTVAVVGGGIAGLAAAFELVQRSRVLPREIDVVCLEAASRAGGVIRSTREEGYLLEWAANGFLDDAPATIALVRQLGLEDRLLRARGDAAKRYLYRAGALRLLPADPWAFLRSDVLSFRGKVRLLLEPAMPRRTRQGDESVFDFARRRLGREAAEVLVDAMASGVFAGDVRRLSAAAAFPALVQMEREHGGLLRGMLARRRTGRRAAGSLLSFPDGMQELIAALVRALGERLRLDSPVAGLSARAGGYRLHLRAGPPVDAAAVVLACPAWIAADIVSGMAPAIGAIVASMATAPIAVAHLGYTQSGLAWQPEGFGFLVPRGEGRRLLGALWASSIFERRAPAGHALYTAMIGGAHDPGAVELPDGELVAVVRQELRAVMGISAVPQFVRVVRHPRGIPQYGLQHLERIAEIERHLGGLPGLWLHGSSYRGVSVNSCVGEASRLASTVLEGLARQ